MWSLYLFVNKLLKLEEDVENSSKDDDSYLAKSCSLLGNGVFLPRSRFVEVPHVNQLYDWDCGLACILMVFQTVGINGYDLPTLGRLCSTRSVWTVDLAYMLHKFSICFSFFTLTLGANPDFCVETFYKDQLPNDLVRVDMLFQRAVGAGMNIECRSVNREELSFLILSGRYIAIALVDQYKFSQPLSEGTCVPGIYDSHLGYTGHYIVVCGYDAASDEFEIRDPANSRKHVRIPSKFLEEARKSFGTDEDLLLISVDQSPRRDNQTLTNVCM